MLHAFESPASQADAAGRLASITDGSPSRSADEPPAHPCKASVAAQSRQILDVATTRGVSLRRAAVGENLLPAVGAGAVVDVVLRLALA